MLGVFPKYPERAPTAHITCPNNGHEWGPQATDWGDSSFPKSCVLCLQAGKIWAPGANENGPHGTPTKPPEPFQSAPRMPPEGSQSAPTVPPKNSQNAYI